MSEIIPQPITKSTQDRVEEGAGVPKVKKLEKVDAARAAVVTSWAGSRALSHPLAPL